MLDRTDGSAPDGCSDVMMRTYRREFVAQMKKRFSIDSHPGKHVLLCWKINPALDTSEQSTIFLGKPSVYQLMEAEYMHKLRHRYQHSISASPSGSGTTATTVAPVLAPATAPPATAPASAPATAPAPAPSRPPAPAPASGSKRKLSIINAYSAFALAPPSNETAVEDVIKSEISKFEALKIAAASEPKYKEGPFFDMLSFFSDCALVPVPMPMPAPVLCACARAHCMGLIPADRRLSPRRQTKQRSRCIR